MLEYYYLMKAPEGAVFSKQTDEAEELVWIPLSELDKNDIRPSFLKDKIPEVIRNGALIHVISEEREKTKENRKKA